MTTKGHITRETEGWVQKSLVRVVGDGENIIPLIIGIIITKRKETSSIQQIHWGWWNTVVWLLGGDPRLAVVFKLREMIEGNLLGILDSLRCQFVLNLFIVSLDSVERWLLEGWGSGKEGLPERSQWQTAGGGLGEQAQRDASSVEMEMENEEFKNFPYFGGI